MLLSLLESCHLKEIDSWSLKILKCLSDLYFIYISKHENIFIELGLKCILGTPVAAALEWLRLEATVSGLAWAAKPDLCPKKQQSSRAGFSWFLAFEQSLNTCLAFILGSRTPGNTT